MGKRQHQKDKMYITYTEWTTLYGGKKSGPISSEDEAFKRLPFDHCCVSLQPFDDPYCDGDGNLFELAAILKYIKLFKSNPVTGKPLEFKDLFKVNFFKNADDEYHCPVMFKVFTKNSHIVCVKPTGNVFSFEAVEQLNMKTKNWKDLINDKPFDRKDIVTIQDPTNVKKFNLTEFHHIKNNIRVETEEEAAERGDPNARIKTMSTMSLSILTELNATYKPSGEKIQSENAVKKDTGVLDQFNAAHFSTGTVAAGFTSSVMPAETHVQSAILDESVVRYDRIKKKGYVRLNTNFGPLNLELHCDLVPKTCENFLVHCANGYYNNTIFHRSIRNFMLQGGDPRGKGTGGVSIWGGKFEDEFVPQLTHTGRGILSMANSGPNTNGSQFFITYRSCPGLNKKHTIFGKLVGGVETLTAIEAVEVDNKDRPIEEIVLQNCQIFVNPYQEVDDQLAQAREEVKKAEDFKKKEALKNTTKPVGPLKVFKQGVGKYINPDVKKDKSDGKVGGPSTDAPLAKKIKNSSNSFGNFSNW